MKKHEENAVPVGEKQPYEAPEVRTEEVFETLALTCVKAVVQCSTAPGTPVVQS